MTNETGNWNKEQILGIQFKIHEEHLGKPLEELEPQTLIATGDFGPKVAISLLVIEYKGEKHLRLDYYLDGDEYMTSNPFQAEYDTVEKVRAMIAGAIPQFANVQEIIIEKDGFYCIDDVELEFYHNDETVLAWSDATLAAPSAAYKLHKVEIDDGPVTAMYLPVDGSGDFVTEYLHGESFDDLPFTMYRSYALKADMDFEVRKTERDEILARLEVLDPQEDEFEYGVLDRVLKAYNVAIRIAEKEQNHTT